jgi:multidrug efflux pump subunit AcrA (membrane-fusion protein)
MAKWMLPAFCLFSLLILSCKKRGEKTKPTLEAITESVYASGIVKSRNQYQVFSAANGLIDQVLVTEGDRVKKGDPLLILTHTIAALNTDNAKIAANYASVASNAEKLHELKIEIDLAKAKMEDAASLLSKQRNLWALEIGTRNELDQRELNYKTAANAWETATLRYTELQKQVSFQEKQSLKNVEISSSSAGDYIIKSETNGKVYSILKEKGEMVNTQSPVAVVGDDQHFLLELQVDEYDIARITTSQKIMVTMDSYKGQVFEAVVEKIDPFMNERSKSFTIEAGFKKQPPALYPNLTCEANIVIQEKQNALTIPRNYLLEGDTILLTNRKKRKVITGLKDYQKVEIRGGLSINDVILKP